MEIIHIFPPNNNKYKNLLDMNDEKKIIIYQVFTRLFGNNNNHWGYQYQRLWKNGGFHTESTRRNKKTR